MLVVAVLMLAIGGAADMASAAFRTSMLQAAADDEVRGRLQGIFIVVVAGGPRVADVGARCRRGRGRARRSPPPAAACSWSSAWCVPSLAVPSFVRYRITHAGSAG